MRWRPWRRTTSEASSSSRFPETSAGRWSAATVGPTIDPVKMPKMGEETRAQFDRVAESFVERGAKRSQMFGMPVLKIRDKVFAGTYGDAMTFKLAADDVAAALKLKGVEPFEPMPGRAMKGWVMVPLEHSKRWAGLAEQAWTFLS